MDILGQAVADTAALHLKGADGSYLYDEAGAKVRIVVYGPGSDAYERVEARQTQRALKRMADNDGKPTAASPEQRRKEQAEDLAELTVAFEGLTYSPAADKSGQDLFKAVYEDKRLGFITEQLTKFVGNWDGFSKGSSTS